MIIRPFSIEINPEHRDLKSYVGNGLHPLTPGVIYPVLSVIESAGRTLFLIPDDNRVLVSVNSEGVYYVAELIEPTVIVMSTEADSTEEGTIKKGRKKGSKNKQLDETSTSNDEPVDEKTVN